MNKKQVTGHRSQVAGRELRGGFTLLIAILTASIVIAIGLAILGVTFKQTLLTGIERNSEVAFQAANAGLECIKYYDISDSNGNSFDVDVLVGSLASPECFGKQPDDKSGEGLSGEEQRYEWTWGEDNDRCSSVSVYKFYDPNVSVSIEVGGEAYGPGTCPAGVDCTVVKARGYNSACGPPWTDGTIEREITAVH